MILVVGATGDLGSEVVHALRAADAPVRCLVRQGGAYFWLNETGASYFFGDLRQADTLRRACEGVRWVVSCAGLRTEGRDSRHDAVTSAGHRALWRAASAAGVQRAVYVSCLGAGRLPDSPAHRARAVAESSLQDSGLEHVILRPSLFATTFALAARFGARHGWVPVLGSGEGLVSPIGLRDLALAVVASLDLPTLQGRCVELGGPQVVTYRQALDSALEAAGAQGCHLAPLPSLITRGGLPLLATLQPRWSARLRELEAHASQDLSVASGAFEAAFGWPPAPLEQSVAAALAMPQRPQNIHEIYPLMQHRGPAATAYEPGTKPISSLPKGP